MAAVLAAASVPPRAAETIPISPLHLEIPVGPRPDEQYGAKAAVKRMMAMHGRAQPENDEDLTNLNLECADHRRAPRVRPERRRHQLRGPGRKVRFEVNPAAAERAKLSIGSEMLKLAKIVGS